MLVFSGQHYNGLELDTEICLGCLYPPTLIREFFRPFEEYFNRIRFFSEVGIVGTMVASYVLSKISMQSSHIIQQ